MCDWTPAYSLRGHGGRPLVHSRGDITLRAINGVRKVRIQALSGTMVHTAALADILDAGFPLSPQVPVATSKTAYWVAPNDWLVLDEERDRVEVALKRIAPASDFAVTDVSDAVSIIELIGTGAVAKLREGCSVDLDDHTFSPGCYALTRLQNLPVTLHRLVDAHTFRVLVDRSCALFLWDWLVTAT